MQFRDLSILNTVRRHRRRRARLHIHFISRSFRRWGRGRGEVEAFSWAKRGKCVFGVHTNENRRNIFILRTSEHRSLRLREHILRTRRRIAALKPRGQFKSHFTFAKFPPAYFHINTTFEMATKRGVPVHRVCIRAANRLENRAQRHTTRVQTGCVVVASNFCRFHSTVLRLC